MLVKSEAASPHHINRRDHGLVFMLSGKTKVTFAEKREIILEKGDIYYLPKFSNYEVAKTARGEVIAVNFEIDDPDKTFIDLYMKSGLYITEIVKRLYQSERMKEQFPDPKERLRHIFEKQVYGLAPTEIIYHIALSYILGFNEGMEDIKHNFRQLDALPYAKEGTLQEKLDELFG